MPSAGAGTARQKVSYNPNELAERFLGQLIAAGRSPLTVAMYRRTINDLYEYCRCDDIRLITREMISAHVDQILARKFGASQKIYWIIRFKIFFHWVADEGLILADPTAHLKQPAAKKRKHPPYLTQQEVARILDSIETKTPEGLRDRALMELLYSSGLRTAEVCKLSSADINFAEGTISVLMGKGKKDRMVPVGKIALHYLDRYLTELRGLRPGPLFYGWQTGNALKGWQLQRQIVSRRARSAGIKKKVMVRTFRHSFAIHMLENGASIRHIQAMLGHADLHTTQKYTNVVPSELKRAHAAAHPAEHRRGRLPAARPKLYVRIKKAG